MSRNTMIIAGAVVVLIILVAVFTGGGGGDAPAPKLEAKPVNKAGRQGFGGNLL